MPANSVYDRLGVRRIINAKGPATRLSGGKMRPEVLAAMSEAAGSCVDMAELQAVAAKRIATVTGAESGLVTSGAAAGLLLATAACITGLDPGRMARLPQTEGLKNEVVVARPQRNFYDHAVRTAGVRLVEVGLPDRYAGAGVRDAEAWEFADAIGPKTAAVLWVAHPSAQPSLGGGGSRRARSGRAGDRRRGGRTPAHFQPTPISGRGCRPRCVFRGQGHRRAAGIWASWPDGVT